VVAIMMTAYGNEESAVQAFRIGAHDYLNKPVRTKDLREILKRFESVIETQKQQQLINSYVTARQMSLEIPTQYDVLLPISHFLAQETADALAKPYDMGIRLGYFELLLNAFEHGNLEIGYHKKREYADSPTLRFQDLVQERLQNEELRNRKIRVEFNASPLEVVVTITDDGAGFDVATINRELSGPEVFRGSGRGIIICECQFDTVEYLGKGNVVRVTKKLNAPAKKLPDFLKL
jgi:DNA-binding response OmpR family regulator